eukprot:COSAG04_NODE_14432_length_568_cov_1.204691_2_plen_86_part_00
MAAANRRLRSLTAQLGSGVAPTPTVTLAEEVDLVIRGVTIVDGTGQPGYVGDVAVQGGNVRSPIRRSAPGNSPLRCSPPAESARS